MFSEYLWNIYVCRAEMIYMYKRLPFQIIRCKAIYSSCLLPYEMISMQYLSLEYIITDKLEM